MADDANFSLELDSLDRVANRHLPDLAAIAEQVCFQLRMDTSDSLPLRNSFPSARELNQGYAELHKALYHQHATAAQVLQDTATSLAEVARVYRTADGQS